MDELIQQALWAALRDDGDALRETFRAESRRRADAGAMTEVMPPVLPARDRTARLVDEESPSAGDADASND